MKSKKIAVTGGIGSGKSTVLSIIKSKGFPVFSCDDIYKEIIQTNGYKSAIKHAFPDVITKGEIDRKRLSRIVFQDNEKRKLLDSIAHPLIMDKLFQKMEKEKDFFIFAEVPLLFEGNFEKLFDEVIVVYRDCLNRINAIKERNGFTDEEAKQRISAQFDYDSPDGKKRIENCNAYILNNNADLSALSKEIDRLLEDFN